MRPTLKLGYPFHITFCAQQNKTRAVIKCNLKYSFHKFTVTTMVI